MPKITVIAKIGNTFHPKYGLLVKGQDLTIDEEDFGDQIFEKPKADTAQHLAFPPPLPTEGEGRGGSEKEEAASQPAMRNIKSTTKPRRY